MRLMRHSIAAFVVPLLLAATTAVAGTVTINAGPTSGSIVVEANDATLREVIDALGARFKFQVESTAAEAGGSVATGRWVGTVDTVVARLLKNHGHIVVRGDKPAGGIARVVLVDAKPTSVVAVVKEGPMAAPQTDRGGPVAMTPAPSPAPDAPPVTSNASGKTATEIATDNGSLSAGVEIAARHAEVIAQQFASSPNGRSNGTAAAAPTTDSAALTIRVASDARALAASLQAICLGSSCATRR